MLSKRRFFSHFGNKIIESEESKPLLDGIYFNSISGEEAAEIEKPFSEIEIKKAVWECSGEKSPGLDGYSFLFIKKFLFFIKEDFIKFINYFFVGSSISKAITSSFLTLIPKSHNPSG